MTADPKRFRARQRSSTMSIPQATLTVCVPAATVAGTGRTPVDIGAASCA